MVQNRDRVHGSVSVYVAKLSRVFGCKQDTEQIRKGPISAKILWNLLPYLNLLTLSHIPFASATQCVGALRSRAVYYCSVSSRGMRKSRSTGYKDTDSI